MNIIGQVRIFTRETPAWNTIPDHGVGGCSYEMMEPGEMVTVVDEWPDALNRLWSCIFHRTDGLMVMFTQTILDRTFQV